MPGLYTLTASGRKQVEVEKSKNWARLTAAIDRIVELT